MKSRNPHLKCLAVLLFLATTGNAQLFSPAGMVAVGANPVAIATGDFNTDGVPDLAVANRSSNNVTVWLRSLFAPSSSAAFAVGTSPAAIAIGDFNRDGAQDLAVANSGDNNITLLLGDGKGAFAPAPGGPVPVGKGPDSLAVADFNRDGIPDLAVANAGSANVTVLLGDGSGGFHPASGNPLNIGTNAGSISVAVAAADFNGDGRPDLAVTNVFFAGDGSNAVRVQVIVLLGDGSGGFSASGNPLSVGGSLGWFTVADFNGDGKPDLAIAGGQAVTILLGNGSGGFIPAAGSPVAVASAANVTATDLNGDGIQDLAVDISSSSFTGVTVLLGNGSGGFTASGNPFTAGSGPGPIAVADFNRDGKPDLAVVSEFSNNVSLLQNALPAITANPALVTFNAGVGQAPPGGIPVTVKAAQAGSVFTVTTNQPWLSAVPNGPTQVVINVNQASLAAGAYSGTVRYTAPGYFGASTTVTLQVTNPSGTLAQVTGSPFAAGQYPVAMATGDFNGDGKLDLAVLDASSNVTVLLGDGSGGFTTAPNSPAVGHNPVGIASGDFNGDGKPDLAITNAGDNSVTVLLGVGDSLGSFRNAPGSPFAVGTRPEAIVLADFNGDGKLDIATANIQDNSVTFLLGNGTGSFFQRTDFSYFSYQPTSQQIAGGPQSLAVGDFNGDGIPDLAIAATGNNSVTLFFGFPGSLPSSSIGPTSVAGPPESIVAAEFNGDGKLDLAVTYSDGRILWANLLFGDGSGGLSSGPTVVVDSGPGVAGSNIAVADFNGDGKLDLAVNGPDNLTVVLAIGSSQFNKVSFSPTNSQPSFVVTGDFNGDGRPDIAIAHSQDNNVVVRVGASAQTGSTLQLQSTPLTVPYGTSLPLTLNVFDLVIGFNVPNGKVTFLDGTTVLGNATQTASPYSFTASGLAAGSHALSATYSGDAANLGSTSNILTVQITQAAQTIAFGPLANVTTGIAPFTISATASSGLTVGFASTTASVCTVTGNIVSIVAAGICSITASQGGNANYLAAPSVAQSFAASQANAASQTITFGPLGNVTFGVPPFTISATASSGLPVSFASSTPKVCTVTGNTVTIVGIGTCSITASQGGNANYLAAPPVTQTFTSSKVSSGTLTAATVSPFPIANATLAASGDFNGDGKLDLAVLPGANNVTVLLGNGSGGFTAAPGSPFAVGTAPNSIAVADFNGDGKADMVVAGRNGLTLLLGNGLGGFTASGNPDNPFPATVATGDFNGDGIPDLVETVGIDAVARFGVVTVLLGNGSGGFTPGTPFRVFNVGVGVISAVADFNRDGKLDVLVSLSSAGSSAVVILGDGSGGFTSALGLPYANVGPIVVGDFNGDGIPDVSYASGSPSGVQVLLGNGVGGFNPGPGSPIVVANLALPGCSFCPPSVTALGDFDGDGILDLFVGDFTVLLGNGSGGFAQMPGAPFSLGGVSYLAADFNGDGRLDLAVANSNNITVLLGALAPTGSTLVSTLSSTPNLTTNTPPPVTIPYGASVPLALTVFDTGPAYRLTTGAVTFSDGDTVLGLASQTVSPYSFTASGLSVGTHTVTARYSGDERSLGSTSNVVTIQVLAASQTITFAPLSNVTFGIAPFTVSATASSGLPVAFASTTSAVCTVVGNVVTVAAPGTCSITANQAGNANFLAAPSVAQSFVVNPGGPVSDEFNGQALNTSLWKFVNPVGDGSYSLNGSQLLLNVPGGSNHDPAFGGADNAVRIFQPAGGGDFTVTVKFDSIPFERYQFEGIVVEQDAANYLRFQFGSTGNTLVVGVSKILSQTENVLFSQVITVPTGATSLWLRVLKTGNNWTEAWSANGTDYNTVGSFAQVLAVADLGPFGGNYNPLAAAAPAFTAKVDYFRNPTVPGP
jgi:hypothetical protein